MSFLLHGVPPGGVINVLETLPYPNRFISRIAEMSWQRLIYTTLVFSMNTHEPPFFVAIDEQKP